MKTENHNQVVVTIKPDTVSPAQERAWVELWQRLLSDIPPHGEDKEENDERGG